MSRDHRKLLVYKLADSLVVRLYRATLRFPQDERFGLRQQLRRAGVSVASNIVEGSARRSLCEYSNFLNTATGSAAEARYLVELSSRLGYLSEETERDLGGDYDRLMAHLQSLIRSLEALGRR